MTQPTPEATNQYDLELHLAGVKGGTPKGEIRLADLAAIASALQELNIRIARSVADQERPGRTRTYTSPVAELRLSGLRGGSTKLALGFGSSPHVLRDDEGVLSNLIDATADRFWQIIEGLSTGQRPAWATPLVADSTLDVITAIKGAAERLIVTRADHRRISILTAAIRREAWVDHSTEIISDTITVTGVLFRVDIESKGFRIRDDVGNAIILEDVQNIDTAAQLVGGRTSATGTAVRTAKGDLRVRFATVASAELPAEWHHASLDAARQELGDLLVFAAAGPGPDPAGVVGLGDDDVDELLAALYG